MTESLVEAVGATLRRHHDNLVEADSQCDLDAVGYAIASDIESWIYGSLKEIPGGYEYLGACSTQLCFKLKDGGELRFAATDGDVIDGISHDAGWDAAFDFYDGALSGVPVTGPVSPTG